MKRYLFGQCNLIIQRLKKVDQKHSQKNTTLIKLQFRLKKHWFCQFSSNFFNVFTVYCNSFFSFAVVLTDTVKVGYYELFGTSKICL